MKNLARNTTSIFYLTLLSLLSMGTIPALGQTKILTDEVKAAVRAEIEEQHKREQKAFIEGDCDMVVSIYSDQATLYANGRQIDSLQTFREFCSRIPRPFSGESARTRISDNFYVLSENAAYFVRTINFESADDEPTTFKKEVVTKVWQKTNDRWKIVHFHSTVHSISDE